MAVYKVKRADGSWYLIGDGAGATAKIRLTTGEWAAEGGAGLAASAKTLAGTFPNPVPFGVALPGLDPVAFYQVGFSGDIGGDGTYNLSWSAIGDAPYVSRTDGGAYVLQQDRPTSLPRYMRPVGALPPFNIRDYVWVGANPSTGDAEYHMRGRIRYGCTGSAAVSGKTLTLRRWTSGSLWSAFSSRAFVDLDLVVGETVETDALPWSWPIDQFPYYTDAEFQPGGTSYEAAANGNLGISTELLADYATSPTYEGTQFVLVHWMVLLPPPDGFSPLSAGD